MNVKARFLFLGTGGSMGVPLIGCSCPVCLSPSPFNKRLRSSALCTVGDKCFLIDCGPDFRSQALTHHIDRLDGVLFTHAHNDHTAGMEDLRIFNWRTDKALPCLLSIETADDIKRRYYYIFEPEGDEIYRKMLARFDLEYLVGDRGTLNFQGMPVGYFTYAQGGMRVNGFKLGNLAYVSDIRDYDESIFEELRGVDILVMSALRYSASHMHFSVDEAVAFSKKVGASHTWLMHVAHELDHDEANAYLPENIRMAYDGLELNFDINMSK